MRKGMLPHGVKESLTPHTKVPLHTSLVRMPTGPAISRAVNASPFMNQQLPPS